MFRFLHCKQKRGLANKTKGGSARRGCQWGGRGSKSFGATSHQDYFVMTPWFFPPVHRIPHQGMVFPQTPSDVRTTPFCSGNLQGLVLGRGLQDVAPQNKNTLDTTNSFANIVFLKRTFQGQPHDEQILWQNSSFWKSQKSEHRKRGVAINSGFQKWLSWFLEIPEVTIF